MPVRNLGVSMPVERVLAALLGLLNVLVYLAEGFHHVPFKLNHSRGGIVLAIGHGVCCNMLVWQSTRRDLTPEQRFQCGAAGWIWLLVATGCSLYLFVVAPNVA